jgi:hypothetical protein
LYSSANIVTDNGMGVACGMGEKINAYRVVVGIARGISTGIGGRIKLK